MPRRPHLFRFFVQLFPPEALAEASSVCEKPQQGLPEEKEMNKSIQSNATKQWLPHESLMVYDMAIKFHVTAMTLLPKRGYTNLRDQLERASLSIVLNIAEGAGRKSAAD